MIEDLYNRYCKQQTEIAMLKKNVFDLQKQLQKAYIKIKNMIVHVDKMRKEEEKTE